MNDEATPSPEPGLREAAYEAQHLIANYLYNEDGENEEWLETALDKLRAALGLDSETVATPSPEPGRD